MRCAVPVEEYFNTGGSGIVSRTSILFLLMAVSRYSLIVWSIILSPGSLRQSYYVQEVSKFNQASQLQP